MSFFECTAPACNESAGLIDLIIRPSRKDLGEFSVARALPAPERQAVGPFIFFDHMGPAHFAPGQGIQVRPHPHIGIAAITYLFDGLIIHRDSLGYKQPIEAGAVNLMIAGRGIVHSERAGDDLDRQSYLHGIQSWMALPDREIEREPAFVHYTAAAIPALDIGGTAVRIIIGEAFGERSPVTAFVDTLYLECRTPAAGSFEIPATVPELAVYVVSGEVESDGQILSQGTMAIARPGATILLEAVTDCRYMILGGAPVGRRELWWNFVAPDWGRIEKAKDDWRHGRFTMIEGDDEFIPLPE